MLVIGLAGTGANAALVGSSAPKMTISGRVMSPDGTGIGGMCVTALRNMHNVEVHEAGTATTNYLGYYRINFREDQGTPMRYAIHANADCGAQGRWQPTYAPENVTLTDTQTTATGVNMTTLPAGRMVGRITDSRNGAAIAGAVVTVYDQSDAWAGDGTADASGDYVAGGLAPGTYTVLVATADYAYDVNHEYLASYAHHQPTFATAEFFDVVAGQDAMVNESLLHSGRIEGQLTDALTGLPLRDIAIELHPLSGAWPLYSDAYTGGQGKFSVTVGPGTYAVCFEDYSGPSGAPSRHQSRCYKNKPWVSYEGPFTDTTPVSVGGFGAVVKNINQALPSSQPLVS
jgi:hypothetical protein